MESNEIERIIKKQKKYFATGRTLPLENRICNLKRLEKVMKKYEKQIMIALEKDLGKSKVESYMSEIAMIKEELHWMYKNLPHLVNRKKVKTPFVQFPSKSFQSPCPYGTVLVMSPWNYPFLLTLEPLIDALAAGNTVIVKPSAYAPCSAQVMQRMLEECFPEYYVYLILGGRQENQALLKQRFDKIFFTGGKKVGREVLRAASNYLTPVTLELGGKSPCIVDETANLRLAARRIVFGKFLNCGQTCVAPDYILCDQRIVKQLIQEIQKEIKRQYGKNPLDNVNYGRIINQKHFNRLLNLIDTNKVIIGGKFVEENLRIEPTVMCGISWKDPIMQEEIFGPILPILTYKTLGEAIRKIEENPHPLALYYFSGNKNRQKKILEKCHFGGGCINDTIIHLATSNLPFGGVGESGMGAYHGKAGFDTFTHMRSIVDKKIWLDIPIRYQPYGKIKREILHIFLR